MVSPLPSDASCLEATSNDLSGEITDSLQPSCSEPTPGNNSSMETFQANFLLTKLAIKAVAYSIFIMILIILIHLVGVVVDVVGCG